MKTFNCTQLQFLNNHKNKNHLCECSILIKTSSLKYLHFFKVKLLEIKQFTILRKF